MFTGLQPNRKDKWNMALVSLECWSLSINQSLQALIDLKCAKLFNKGTEGCEEETFGWCINL